MMKEEETREVFVQMVASSFAAYCERCGVADEPWLSARASLLLRRCCSVVNAKDEIARRCLSSAMLTCTIGERTVENNAQNFSSSSTESFVLVYTSEKVLYELGLKLNEDAKLYLRTAIAQVAALEIGDASYDAPTRAVLKRVVHALALDWRPVAAIEAKAFYKKSEEKREKISSSYDNEIFSKEEEEENYRFDDAVLIPKSANITSEDDASHRLWLRVSIAAVGGGALLALTGGAAAPSLAASIIGATNAEGVACCITGIFASLGAGVSGLKARRRFALGQEFRLQALRAHGGRQGIASFILVPGWREPGRDAADAFGGEATRESPEMVSDININFFSNKNGNDDYNTFTTEEDEEEYSLRSWEKLPNVISKINKTTERNYDEKEKIDSSTITNGQNKADEEEEYLDWWRERVPYAYSAEPLVWESKALERLHRTMVETNVWVQARDRAARSVLDEILRRSALGAAALPLAVLDRAAALDDPWAIAIARAKKAGTRLAEHLLQSLKEETTSEDTTMHPITLVGYSIGARVVMHCLEALDNYATENRDSRALGLVENAVFLGAPLAARHQRWLQARRVVAGRLINGYSSRDWMLRLVYRSKAWSLCGVAGAEPVRSGSFSSSSSSSVLDHAAAPAIENTDLSDLAFGHLSYPYVMPQIFHRLQLEE